MSSRMCFRGLQDHLGRRVERWSSRPLIWLLVFLVKVVLDFERRCPDRLRQVTQVASSCDSVIDSVLHEVCIRVGSLGEMYLSCYGPVSDFWHVWWISSRPEGYNIMKQIGLGCSFCLLGW